MLEPLLCRHATFSAKYPTFSPVRALSWTRLKSTTCAKTLDAAVKTSTKTEGASLSWPEYLAIRRNKRRWQMAATVPCALLGFGGGIAYFGSLETDPLKPILGLDPFFFYGFCTVGCLGVGAMIGPSLGSAFWRATRKARLPLIDAKDVEFYRRIAKYRVSAELQRPTAPVPDYYGEKIGSLHQYRQWLRDQNKYKRKSVLPEE